MWTHVSGILHSCVINDCVIKSGTTASQHDLVQSTSNTNKPWYLVFVPYLAIIKYSMKFRMKILQMAKDKL